MNTLEKGTPVSFMTNGCKSIGEITELPSENPDNVYEIKDFLLDETVSIPHTAIVREVQPNEMFRVFVVQKKPEESWKDVQKFREKADAKDKKENIAVNSRIISEVLQV